MWTIGPNSLRVVCPTLSKQQAKNLAPVLGSAMRKCGITTKRRAAMFIAQLAHESVEFHYTSEIWGPTAAQRGYEGRRDLGNTHPGDGSRFRGRAYLQVTGRANYTALSKALGFNFVAHPEALAQPKWAALASAYWFKHHGLNEISDHKDVAKATKTINGGFNGFAERKKYYRRALIVSKFLTPRLK